MLIKNSVIYRFLCVSWVLITMVPRKNSFCTLQQQCQAALKFSPRPLRPSPSLSLLCAPFALVG